MNTKGKGPTRPRFTRTKDYLQCRYYRYIIRISKFDENVTYFVVLFRGERVYSEHSADPEVTIMELIEDIFEKETDEDIH